MAPPPEYDKEPKAPDKSVTTFEDPKNLLSVNDHQNNINHKTSNQAGATDIEKNKVEDSVENLDDERLRALLDEAVTYKNPKDREGKSDLFKNLLEVAEQDNQESEAVAHTPGVGGARVRARGGVGAGARRALPHSNSLQDLVAAALAAEPAPRRHRNHGHTHAHSSVSARATHGGSLPSGVDTSFLLGEEPSSGRGAGYLATVRCVNPPPLAERRVSASDAHCPADATSDHRRSKPVFPMTYTARATLEIGSGSVCSGRAVTTTTASHQVRTRPLSHRRPTSAGKPWEPRGPQPNFSTPWHEVTVRYAAKQNPPTKTDHKDISSENKEQYVPEQNSENDDDWIWKDGIDRWYEGIPTYYKPLQQIFDDTQPQRHLQINAEKFQHLIPPLTKNTTNRNPNIRPYNIAPGLSVTQSWPSTLAKKKTNVIEGTSKCNTEIYFNTPINSDEKAVKNCRVATKHGDYEESDISLRKKYRERVGNIAVPNVSLNNPKNIRCMTIGSVKTCYESNDVDVKNVKRFPKNNLNKNMCPDTGIGDSSVTKQNNTKANSKVNKQSENHTPDPHILGAPNHQKQLLKCNATESHNDQVDKLSTDIELIDLSSKKYVNDNNTNLIENLVGFTKSNNVRVEDFPAELITDIELKEMPKRESKKDCTFSEYYAGQLKLLATIEATNNEEIMVFDKENKKKIEYRNDARNKEIINKATLKLLVFENLKCDSVKPGEAIVEKKGDSAIPYSCITTPEVVTSCNTTSSSPQSAVAVDPKPLQLPTSYLAVASLTGAAPPPAAACAPAPASACDTTAPATATDCLLQPRSVISSSFNGLSLARANYGATGGGAPDEYKKSLDENGNAVQGFGSPVSGSNQHKKPRRKKSSKNETVIKSHQIDGYQGNKDLNEVLRFIESNAARGRDAHAEPRGKLARLKHKDDDDKGAKKRSAERRKDKPAEPKRASSLEELSRTKLEDLTHAAQARSDAKPERRSWGDDARDYFRAEPAPPAPSTPPAPPAPSAPTEVELTDFQTVTKRRKARRREPEPEPPRRPSAPPRARRPSAPPSDRSNDSNDDLDSVHSLPPLPHAATPNNTNNNNNNNGNGAGSGACLPVSYADMARTRHHNIPDLIESCNFYAEVVESEGGGGGGCGGGNGGGGGGQRGEGAGGASTAGDHDAYPALPARNKPPQRPRKERPATATAECPAPDVVSDRRPPVILVEASGGGELDGVTFGFDVNEQLLGARRRCDLVRDVPGLVRVRPGLRYRAPPTQHTQHNEHHRLLVDYVGNAWEDVMRCGGKAHYYSE